MNIEEFSSEFDTLLSSNDSFKEFISNETNSSIGFDEFEKSVFLTNAQEELVVNLYSGTVLNGFENTERNRRYLDGLLQVNKQIELADFSQAIYVPKAGLLSYEVDLTKDNDTAKMLYIIYESVNFEDRSLKCGDGKTVTVYPIRHDELSQVVKNPFRGANTSRVLRIDVGYKKVELLSSFKLGTYFISFLKKPTPIILANLEEQTIDGYHEPMNCILDSSLHRLILELAVQKALASKGLNKQ